MTDKRQGSLNFINFVGCILLTLTLTSIISASSVVFPQDSSKSYIFFPKPVAAKSFNFSVGASMTVIPKSIAQEGVFPLPLTDFRMKYGLTDNLYLSGQANLIYVTNQISLGVGWSYSSGKFYCAFGDDFGYWFGFADFQGFNSTAMGLTNFPSITLGLEIDELSLSFRTEALFTISQHTYFGNASVGRFKPALSGVAFTLAIEQELWKNNYFLSGVRIQYALPLYQTWVAFSTFNRWLIFPEFFVGYEL